MFWIVRCRGWKKKRAAEVIRRSFECRCPRHAPLSSRPPHLISGLEHESEEVLDETGVCGAVDCSQHIQYLLVLQRNLNSMDRQDFNIRVDSLPHVLSQAIV